MLNIIVVGALGLIGHRTVQTLSNRGHNVISLDSEINPKWNSGWKAAAELERRNVAKTSSGEVHFFDPSEDPEQFLKILQRSKPDVIVNVGGNSLASEFVTRAHLLNETMTKLNNLCLHGSETFGCRYVFVSSSMVYGDFTEYPQREASLSGFPKDPYGALKLSCELQIRAVGFQNPALDYAILRPSAVYGENDTNERVLIKFLHAASRGLSLGVRDKSEALDFTHVDDVANMLALACELKGAIRDVYNLSNGSGTSLGSMLAILATYFPVTLIEQNEEDILRPKRGTLSMEKFVKRFGASHSRPGTDGYKQVIEASIAKGFTAL